ncbi:phage protein [Orenia marismortui]|uniref:Uncharacterized protein n=1 Tax=Orenia marismortui TaxID=46469 RepID=A0A4R8H1Q0_9FIRM|nr:hypothetical protein [Orenia marismortui]TDX48333.1 hypothetical protein C7959_13060 [Orenia marismortui]
MINFGRVAEFVVDDRVFKFPELEIDFRVNFDTESDSNSGNIKLYNLNDKSIELFKKDKKVVLKAGYGDDIGAIMKPIIKSATSEFNGNDKITKIVLSEAIEGTINLSWSKNTRASTIIKDVINKIPLDLGDLDIATDKKYRKGKTFSCEAKEALKELAKDTESKFHVSRGKIYFRPLDKATYRVIKLNKDNGLIASPQLIDSGEEDRWKVQALLRYEIEPDIVLDIESLTLNGQYRVVSGSFTSDFITECEVVKL